MLITHLSLFNEVEIYVAEIIWCLLQVRDKTLLFIAFWDYNRIPK